MADEQSPIVIGIAGGTGSGKTTVANGILNRVGKDRIAYLPHDAYYRDLHDLPYEQRAAINFDHPNSLESELMIKHVLQLKQGISVDIPIYDFSIHTRTDKTIHVQAHPVIIVEGILIFAEPEMRKIFDVKIFVDTDADIRFIRRLERDIAERGRTTDMVIHQYLSTVRPMHLDFVEPSKRYADIIIPEGGLNNVAMDMIIARIEALLQKNH